MRCVALVRVDLLVSGSCACPQAGCTKLALLLWIASVRSRPRPCLCTLRPVCQVGLPVRLSRAAQVKLTLMLAVVAVPINTAFGVTFAILLVRSEFWGKTLVMSMLDLPFSISPVVTGGHPVHPCFEFLYPHARFLSCPLWLRKPWSELSRPRPDARAAVRAQWLVCAGYPRHWVQHCLRIPW